MSNAPDSQQPPEITEQTETIVDLNLPLPPPPPAPEDEWGPNPEPTKMSDFHTVEASATKMKSLNALIESFQSKADKFLHVQNVLDQNKALLSYVETLEWLQSQEYLLEALHELNQKQGVRCGRPLKRWVQSNDHCYHQTMEMVSWLDCFDICVSLNATFLKTEGSRLKNVMELIAVGPTWLGLSYREKDNEWKWEDGSSPSPGLGLPEPSLDFQGKCVYVKAHTLGTDNCTIPSSCLCEKAVH
ncbi:C-type lectin domain family 9 member A-like isoform X3 [Prionailurus viverrinus]|uniref:C-type lectin domain family 9 member A-like isoform X3 n=1 Tax=Prionailurus viverrinus TaxID=61388 RepID=UPI001FF43063|nr:C-type lectin domain family 9 member A-like isoform X3 [Prionailurus viverrinus]